MGVRAKTKWEKDANSVKTPAHPTSSNGEAARLAALSAEAGRLNSLARENAWRLFNVTEIRALFNIGEQTMIRYRKLSSRDQVTDPWINDVTRPEKFEAWLWGKRVELEMQHKDV